jgi:Ca2+-binding EF-hand superfamily protein
VTTRFIIACAAAALGTGALAQNAAKPIARADYTNLVNSHFAGADSNHDGFVSKAELVTQEQRELQQAKAKLTSGLQDQFKRLDTNHDGQLSLPEFLAAAPPVHAAETPDQIMARLDTNHDGKISAEEYRAPELAKFNKVDANHDGIVTPDEIRAAAVRK